MLDDSTFARLWRARVGKYTVLAAHHGAVNRELVARGIDTELAVEVVKDIDDEESAFRAGLRLDQKLKESDIRAFRRKLWGLPARPRVQRVSLVSHHQSPLEDHRLR